MTSYTIATPDATTTTLQEATVEAFRRRLRGPLLVPRDEGFEAATRLWNGMIAKTPALVVTAAGTADVVAAVSFARDHGLSLSVRGGGHNIAGTALADGGLTIDLSGSAGSSWTPGHRPRSSEPGACSARWTARPSATAWPHRWAFSPRSAWLG
jgi:hypothetical protein